MYFVSSLGTEPGMMEDEPTKLTEFARRLNGLDGRSRAELREKRTQRKSAPKARRGLEVCIDELKAIIDGAVDAPLPLASHRILWGAVCALFEERGQGYLSSEKSKAVVAADLGSPNQDAAPDVEPDKPLLGHKKRPKHRGRRGAKDFPSAEKTQVTYEGLSVGQACPCGCGGRLGVKPDSVVISFFGQSPIQPVAFECERFRCSSCGEVFTATPPGKGKRHQPSAISMMALMKYGSGFPFHRMGVLLGLFGIPLAATTQFQMVCSGAKAIWPVYAELLDQGAQGKVIHTDDTKMKILEGDRPDEFAKRSGTFTTGIQCHLASGVQIAIFLTGVKHAGEELADLLKGRREGLEPPVHMSDGLPHNTPKLSYPAIVSADCLVHGRRYFVKLIDSFPQESLYVLEAIGTVYANEALSKERGLSQEQRLAFHQQQSKPVLDGLKSKMQEDLNQKIIEHNSALGKAYRYLLKRWEGLTVFLRVPGAPIDNNAIERQLKKAVLNRKNSLFYRSDRGALVGDIYMSLIKTCELNGVSPFDYLNQLLLHPDELAASPGDWMPWTYRETLSRLAAPPVLSGALPRAA